MTAPFAAAAVGPEPFHQRFIQFNTEPRGLRQRKRAVDQLRLGRNQFAPQHAVEDLGRDHLEERGCRTGGLKMTPRRRGNARLPTMRGLSEASGFWNTY